MEVPCTSSAQSCFANPKGKAWLHLFKVLFPFPEMPPTISTGSGSCLLHCGGFMEQAGSKSKIQPGTGGTKSNHGCWGNPTAGTGLTWERSQWQVGLLVMAGANHDSVEDMGLTDTMALSDHLPLA